jgi:hypothetical protein
MSQVKERYLTDENGRRIGVLLDVAEYQRLLAALEELESIRAYDEAVLARDEAVPFDDAADEIRRSRQ